MRPENGWGNMRAPISTAIAIAIGIVVLLGYFVQLAILQNIRTLLIGWAVIVAGAATLIGITNLVQVHWHRVRAPKGRDILSGVLLGAFVLTLFFGLFLGPSDSNFQRVVTSIQMPIEASLMAVLAISLAYASLRLLQKRKNTMTIIFITSTILFLLLSSGFLATGENKIMAGVLGALNQLPVAGGRGLLLGIGLGSLVTGLRILLGSDRPFSG
jgi:hypothetical protein